MEEDAKKTQAIAQGGGSSGHEQSDKNKPSLQTQKSEMKSKKS